MVFQRHIAHRQQLVAEFEAAEAELSVTQRERIARCKAELVTKNTQRSYNVQKQKIKVCIKLACAAGIVHDAQVPLSGGGRGAPELPAGGLILWTTSLEIRWLQVIAFVAGCISKNSEL
jgi:hypothetical protein